MSKPKLFLGAALLTAVLALPATGSADAAAYRHYVACGITEKAKPSHACPRRAKKGAFFKAKRADTRYTICMRLPSGRSLCAKRQLAEQGVLYVNKITSTAPGKHQVTWFVKGKRVGRFFFFVRR